MARPGFQPTSNDNYRVGRRIRVPEVRVIAADGQQVGILPTHEALRMAEEQGLELVEVNPRAAPPVCRIMDYGKFKYETSKKEKESRKHQSTVLIKEVKLRPKTDVHDLEFKVKHIRRFLDEGNKCKLVIVFRGREIVHPETGHAMLDAVVKYVSDIASVEQKPMMEGRRMVMIIGPRAGVIRVAGASPTPMIPITKPIPPPPGQGSGMGFGRPSGSVGFGRPVNPAGSGPGQTGAAGQGSGQPSVGFSRPAAPVSPPPAQPPAAQNSPAPVPPPPAKP